MRRTLLLSVLMLLAVTAVAQAPLGYYRDPVLHDDQVVFIAEGDLWLADITDGLARRLTSHQGDEMRPAISADGRTLAFSATYEGPREVYTMPLQGGLPTRWTWEGRYASVVGWTPEGKLLYATSNYSSLPSFELAQIDIEEGVRSRLPLCQASDGSFADDMSSLFFTRPIKQGSYTKRYKGGTAQKVWRFDGEGREAVCLTADFTGTSRTPMYWRERVYYLCDRDGTMNIWSMRSDGGDRRQHTFHDGWDVLGPSLNQGRIIYQLGADLRLYDIAANRDRVLALTLLSDFEQTRERWVEDPLDWVSATHLADSGDRVVLTARGEIFVAPAEHGRFIELTRNSNVRYRQAMFLPGGDTILALSDESGEVEWWEIPISGDDEPRQITDDGKSLRFGGEISPDGEWVLSNNRANELWLSKMSDGESRRLAFSQMGGFDGYTFSPDSRWVAWSCQGANELGRIWLYNIESGKTTALTTDRYNSWSPAFGPDGKWLYFLSDRNFRSLVRSPWGQRQPEPFWDSTTMIFMIALGEGELSPFQPADEVAVELAAAEESESPAGRRRDKRHIGRTGREGADDAEDTDADEEEVEELVVEIALEGLAGRLFEVPVEPGNYGGLSVNAERLFWTSRSLGSYSRNLLALDIGEDPGDPATLFEGVRGYMLSGDGTKLLIRSRGGVFVSPASVGSVDTGEAEVDLSGWAFSLNPREEWRQMFIEGWRLHRDYLYDENMHGVDWDAMLDKYLPLVDRVTTRAELADLQGQMAGELSVLHTYIYGGDMREGADDITPGKLGALFERDERAGGFRVTHIFRHDPDRPDAASPLARPGVAMNDGDVILAVNGKSALSVIQPSALLRNKIGRQVRLSIRDKDDVERDVIVEPIAPWSERQLRYHEWEYTRRLRVAEASDDRIGYIHLRAMSGGDIDTWGREFYAQIDRQGLIIDVRHNGGGSIDSWILERLLRPAWFFWSNRDGTPTPNMQKAFRGHLVVLINEETASDGEIFAEGFRRLGLGKVIGTRTWGGEVWLTSSNDLVDGGIVTAAEFGTYSLDGEWLIEGHGVDPDIEVDNLPHATFNGGDAQLDAAIAHLQDLIRDDPRELPAVPAYPDKSHR
ncbi:MAG: protease [bacterium]|nr:protease [bacterium]